MVLKMLKTALNLKAHLEFKSAKLNDSYLFVRYWNSFSTVPLTAVSSIFRNLFIGHSVLVDQFSQVLFVPFLNLFFSILNTVIFCPNGLLYASL